MDNPQQQSDKKLPDKTIKDWLSYSGMAFEFFAVIAAFTALGYYLDKKFTTQPILLIVFLLLGLCASFYRIFKQFK